MTPGWLQGESCVLWAKSFIRRNEWSQDRGFDSYTGFVWTGYFLSLGKRQPLKPWRQSGTSLDFGRRAASNLYSSTSCVTPDKLSNLSDHNSPHLHCFTISTQFWSTVGTQTQELLAIHIAVLMIIIALQRRGRQDSRWTAAPVLLVMMKLCQLVSSAHPWA